MTTPISTTTCVEGEEPHRHKRLVAFWLALSVLLPCAPIEAAETGKQGAPDTADLLAQVLPQFHKAVDDDETSVYRFTFPLKMASFVESTETTSVFSRWNVKADAVQRLCADLNSNGREEVYVAFETHGALAQDGSWALARWLCLRGFERAPDDTGGTRWQPLLIERNETPHFADEIERFDIVDLGGLKGLCLQNASTDAQATPRGFRADFTLYALRGQILVPILETKIAHGCYGGGGEKPYRWQREVQFLPAKGSRMKDIHIAEAREMRHSITDSSWHAIASTVRLARDPIPGVYRWVPAKRRYVKWE